MKSFFLSEIQIFFVRTKCLKKNNYELQYAEMDKIYLVVRKYSHSIFMGNGFLIDCEKVFFLDIFYANTVNAVVLQ